MDTAFNISLIWKSFLTNHMLTDTVSFIIYQGIGLKLDIEFYNWNDTGKQGTIQIHSVTVE